MDRLASRTSLGVHQTSDRGEGFTILELLIVIVVIAILATITIISYNGVSNRAREASVMSAVEQASKKILIYAATNGGQYPPTTAEAGVANGNTNYQYSVDNSATPEQFCITATLNGISYFASSTNGSPKAGGCAGHGLNGGAVATNYFTNPQFTGAAVPVSHTGGVTTALAIYGGSQMARATATSAGTVGIRLQPNSQRWSISPGQRVFALSSICNAATSIRSFATSLRFYDQPGTSATLGAQVSSATSSTIIIPAMSCNTISVSGTAPASAQSVGLNANRNASSESAANDVFYVDDVFMSDSMGVFADGNSPGWIWNGTPQGSTSTGPAL